MAIQHTTEFRQEAVRVALTSDPNLPASYKLIYRDVITI